jgi:DNA-binding LacI/PurR family transcriptional regulator
VEAAINELGYQPNAIARFMAKGRTRTLACFSPNLTDYTYASIIEGAEYEARQSGYFLMTASAPDSDTFTTLVEQLVASRRTEGLLLINPFMDERYTQLPEYAPVVFVGARSSQNTMDSVFLDDEEAGRIATRHLVELGHQSIALITGPLEEDCSRDRQAGYTEILESAGLNLSPDLIRVGDWSATSGYQAVQSLIESGIEFTAIFAQNDRMAVGAIRALREAGKSVPDDVSIIGFDDMPLASYYDPALTTIRQDTFCIGREAARLLIRAIENPEKQRKHLRVPVELVLRNSTARCKP